MVLHAAPRIPDAPLQARRHRVHPATSSAQEVDEDTFFHSRETRGTIVSTALEEMMRAAHALQSRALEHLRRASLRRRQLRRGSDRCASLMANEILLLSQYFAYIEVGAEATLRHG